MLKFSFMYLTLGLDFIETVYEPFDNPSYIIVLYGTSTCIFILFSEVQSTIGNREIILPWEWNKFHTVDFLFITFSLVSSEYCGIIMHEFISR